VGEGGISMRILLIAVALFIVIHFLRIDLAEGTIPTASYNPIEEPCIEETFTIAVTSVEGDTIESLFALYPDPKSDFIERLSDFYSLNPHLKQQAIIGGEKIKLPLSHLQTEKCTK